jgi:hypothetical protein
MTAAAAPLTSSQVLASASELLQSGGYTVVPPPANWQGTVRLFEDSYGIVALQLYETWEQLIQGWHLAQGQLVDLISEHLSRPEPKAWEGYLALFTTGTVTADDRTSIAELRYDTNRVRKLVSTGEELETLQDVRVALLPLLPLDLQPPSAARAGLLDVLPDLMADDEVSREIVEGLVAAFMDNTSIVERLHELRGQQS